jgi:hypothetical protein
MAKGFKGKYFSLKAITATVSTFKINSLTNSFIQKKITFNYTTSGISPPKN